MSKGRPLSVALLSSFVFFFFLCFFKIENGVTSSAYLRVELGLGFSVGVNGLNCSNSTPDVMVTLTRIVTGHFMTLIEVTLHKIKYNPGSQQPTSL